jgi:predicted MFS family arabinose efflux permease
VHVAIDRHGSAALLGLYWVVFGVGAIIGELSAPYLRRWPVWPVMTGIVLAWGLTLLPLGLPGPLWVGLAAFFAGGVIFGPWMSLSMGVFQDASPPGTLAQVLAARSSLLILAGPIGTALGGPLVAALGARGTFLVSALATIALALITTAVLARTRARAVRTSRADPRN